MSWGRTSPRSRPPYTAADFNWNNKASRSTVEMEDATARPELAAEPGDLSGYDTALVLCIALDMKFEDLFFFD